MHAIAKARKINITPRKARLVVNLVRNKNANEALIILDNVEKAAGYEVKKVIASAIANAVNNHGLKADDLIVKEIQVNDGAVLKRVHPRARGRSAQVLKRSCHIIVKVSEKEAR